MNLQLSEKNILITGGAKGIGSAIAHACAAEGAIPLIIDRDEAAVLQLQREFEQQGVRSDNVIVDLTDLSRSLPLIRSSLKKWGHIEGLVNNAGTNDGIGLEHGSPDQFAHSLRQNLVHYYTTTQLVLPFLKESKGTVVNIASKVAFTGQGGTSGYAAAKGAILELTTEWAAELSIFGIRVNAIVPAEVSTPQYQSWVKTFKHPEEELARIKNKIPSGHRLTEPIEIADAVMLLLSPLSRALTGRFLFVDGGYVHLDRSLT